MGSNTYTEDEFKQVLKNLFAEKKRVKELEKQIEERGLQKKFQTKLTDIHRLSVSEEYAKLKAAYLDKETENSGLKAQLEKVKPALKRLVEDLKSARAEIETLKMRQQRPEIEHAQLDDALKRIQELEAERNKLSGEEKEALQLQQSILQLEEQLEKLSKRNTLLEQEAQLSEQKIQAIQKNLEDERAELARARANEQKETGRFESERSRLVEKLADSLSQVQRQTEIIKDLRIEVSAAQKKCNEYAEQEKIRQNELQQLQSELAKITLESAERSTVTERQLTALKKENEELHSHVSQLELKEAQLQEIQEELQKVKAELENSDLVALQESYELKLHEAHVLADQAMTDKEESLEKTYVKMRELSERHAQDVQKLEQMEQKCEELEKNQAKWEKEQLSLQTSLKNVKLQCEERDAEIRKAQQHLAKKVKEATLLHDLAEKQKSQLLELQSSNDKQQREIERLQNNLQLQSLHEEKIQAMANERTQAAEQLTKEWQEKFLALQQDWQEKKGQLIELQKLRKTYEQMSSTFLNLKHIIGHAFESPPKETQEKNNSGD